MKKKIIIVLALFLIFYITFSFLTKTGILKGITDKISPQSVYIIKRYLFPYKLIAKLERENNELEVEKYELQDQISNLTIIHDIELKKSLTDLKFNNLINKISINFKKLELKIFQNKKGFLMGMNNLSPGSAFVENYNDDLFILSAVGILGYGKLENNQIIFKQISNNIDKFISFNQLSKGELILKSDNKIIKKKSHWFSTKDLKIFDDKVYVSYTREVSKDCWNTSVIVADLNFKELNFKHLFSPNFCIHSSQNKDNEFVAHQSGGRIINMDKNHILFSTGEYRSRYLSQDKESTFGKILKINIDTKKFEVLSMGHRNPQGLFYDKKNKFVLTTEHGPQGGDEINLIELNKKEIPNYGWPISSYGEHYGGKFSYSNKAKYIKYPLLKSHKDNNFIEPLKYFTPSIGIAQIIGINKDKNYVASSMKDKSIYFFNLDKQNNIENFKRVEIGERIRDLLFYQNKIIMFLEDTASIGIIDLKN